MKRILLSTIVLFVLCGVASSNTCYSHEDFGWQQVDCETWKPLSPDGIDAWGVSSGGNKEYIVKFPQIGAKKENQVWTGNEWGDFDNSIGGGDIGSVGEDDGIYYDNWPDTADDIAEAFSRHNRTNRGTCHIDAKSKTPLQLDVTIRFNAIPPALAIKIMNALRYQYGIGGATQEACKLEFDLE